MSKARAWLRSIKAKFTATPGTSVEGIDRQRKIMKIAGRMLEVAKANTKRHEEEDRKWKYEEREHYVCLAIRLTDNRVSTRPFYEVRTVTEVEGCKSQAWGRGWTIDEAEHECRFRLANLFWGANLTRTYDEARDRASRVRFTIERSFAHGTMGIA